MWGRSLLDPAEDDTSRQADLRRAIRMVEKQQRNAIWVVLLIGALAAWHYEDVLSAAQVIPAALIVGLLLAIHEQLCAIRADAFRRELRDLPPRWPVEDL